MAKIFFYIQRFCGINEGQNNIEFTSSTPSKNIQIKKQQ